MIKFPLLRRIVLILLAVLPEVYSFVEWLIGFLVLTLVLRWTGLAGGTFARVVSTIWIIISAIRYTVRRQHVNNRKSAASSSPLAAPMPVANELSRIPLPLDGEALTGVNRRDEAIQRVMGEEGLSREEA
jgi:hypothetical protein